MSHKISKKLFEETNMKKKKNKRQASRFRHISQNKVRTVRELTREFSEKERYYESYGSKAKLGKKFKNLNQSNLRNKAHKIIERSAKKGKKSCKRRTVKDLYDWKKERDIKIIDKEL